MKRFHKINNQADSNVVSMIIIVPLFIIIFMSIIDISLFFPSRSQLQDMAADGARMVAVFGGNGDGATQTPIEAKYGKDKRKICGSIDKNTGLLSDDLKYPKNLTLSGVECSIAKNVSESYGLVNTRVTGVSCSPSISKNLNETATCLVSFEYNSLPGSVFWLLNTFKGQNGTKLYEGKHDPLSFNIVAGTAQTEVDLSGQSLQYRK